LNIFFFTKSFLFGSYEKNIYLLGFASFSNKGEDVSKILSGFVTVKIFYILNK